MGHAGTLARWIGTGRRPVTADRRGERQVVHGNLGPLREYFSDHRLADPQAARGIISPGRRHRRGYGRAA